MAKTADKIAELRKEFRDSTKEEIMKQEFAKTGCHLTDLFYGGGRGLGILYGICINFCGDTGSGKSMTGNELIAKEHHRRKDKFHHQYEDNEKGNDFDTTTLYGFDIMKENLLLTHPKAKKMSLIPETVQDMDARTTIFLNMIPKDHYGIYFVDSLDAVAEADVIKRAEKRAKAYEKGEDFDEGTYGMGAAKFLSQEFFRTQAAKLEGKKVIIGFVSQVREVIGATKYQKKLKTSGGKAKKHWMNMEVWFRIVAELKNDGSKLVNGLVVEVSGVKSRDGRMKRSCRFNFYPDYGIDDIGTSLDYVYDLRNDSGEMRKSVARNIPWEAIDKPKADLKGVTEWLKVTEDRLEKYRDFRKKIDGKKNIKASVVMDYVESESKLKKAYEDYFGKSYTREDLHKLCTENKVMRKRLEKMVTDKWENLEKEAASGLGSKYG